jgi:hypothetical protein
MSVLNSWTPLNFDRAQYRSCFGYITATALRLVQSNYDSTDQPSKPCTRVFKGTTGLPCVYTISDIRADKISLLPSDFHSHWHWVRYTDLAKPILDPLCTTTYLLSASGTTHSTRRIPSAFEASETRERRCGLCRLPGYTRAGS